MSSADPDRRAVHGKADIAAIEQQPYESAVPVRSTYALLQRTAELHADRPAIIYLPNGAAADEPHIVSFHDLLASVNRAANLFTKLGITRSDSVALLMPTMPETIIALFAAQAAGRVCPINYMLSAEYIADLIDHAGAKVLVALGPDDELAIWDKIDAIRRRSKCLRHVLMVGAGAANAESFAAATLRESEKPEFETQIERDDIASYFHTGGTTGLPKLVKHTHGNEVHVSWFSGMYYGIGPDDVVLNGFPMFHVAGAFVLAGSAIAAGAATLIPSKLGMRCKAFVRDYWSIVERHRVSLLSGGPTFISTILGRPLEGIDTSAVKALYGGGSAMPAELAAEFEKRFRVPVRSIYGMTESAGLIATVPRTASRQPGSSGRPLPFCQVKAFAPGADGKLDPKRPLAPDQAGLLAIRGPNVSPGYTNQNLTRDTITDDGWFVTGDTGKVDADGQVFVIGRSKDVIIRGGHNIDPLVIEEALMHHPDVQYCAAVGQPDPYAGELPVAFLKLKPDSIAGAQEILEATKRHIPEPAAVPKQLYLLDEIPLTTTGKVFKPALRAIAAEKALRDQLNALLGDGLLIAVRCNEVLGQRHVTINLAREDYDNASRIVSAHMTRMAIPFDIAAD